jgi:hypothetical protein
VIRPFRHNYTDEEQMWIKAGKITHRAVSHGRPMAQRYGFGAVFSTKLNIDALLRNTTAPSALRTWTEEIIEQHYVVGPPYLATGRDFYNIVQQWAEFVVPVYFQTGKGFLSEMFAYSIAAAHLGLPHQIVPNFMVSNVDSGAAQEGWSAVDDFLSEENVCSKLTGTLRATLPPVLHYCQSYFLGGCKFVWARSMLMVLCSHLLQLEYPHTNKMLAGPYFFSKYSVPEQFMSCEHPLFAIPNSTAFYLYNSSTAYDNKRNLQVFSLDNPRTRKRHAFMVCQMLRLLNEVATHFKSQLCVLENRAVNLNEFFMWKTEDKF